MCVAAGCEVMKVVALHGTETRLCCLARMFSCIYIYIRGDCWEGGG
jgi:hypothetical protein